MDRVAASHPSDPPLRTLLLERVSALAAGAAASESLLRAAAGEIARVLRGGCAIDLRAPDGGVMLPVALEHADPEAAALLRSGVGASRELPASGLAGRLAAGDPLVLASGREVRRLACDGHWPFLAERGAHTAIVVPLVVRGESAGVLLAFRDDDPAPLGDEERDALRAVAGVLAFAVDRDRATLGALESAAAGRRRFEALAETALDGIHVADDDARITWANAAAGEIFGVPAAELVGRRLEEFVPPEERARFEALWESFLATGRRRGRYPMLRADGALRHVEYSAIARYVPGGHFAIIRDVTGDVGERRGGRMLAAIVDVLQEAIIPGALDGTITGWNAAAERLFGFTAAETVGQNIAAFTPPQVRGQIERSITTLRRGLSIGPQVTERRRKDGAPVRVRLRVEPVRDAGGDVVSAVAIVTDAATDPELAAQLDHYRRIVEHVGDGIWSVDADLRTTSVNPRMAAMAGWRPDQLIGRPVTDFMDPEDVAAFRAQLAALPTGAPVRGEATLRRPGGDGFRVLVTAAALRDRDGVFVGATGVVVDISAQHSELLAAQEAEARFRRIVDDAGEAVLTLGLDGRVTFANPAFAALVGQEPGDVLGRSPAELGLAELATAAAARFATTLRGPDGTQRQVLASRSPLRGPEGEEEGSLWLLAEPAGEAMETVAAAPPPEAAVEELASARAAAEAERARLAEHLRRVYRVLLGTNQALVRVATRQELFAELCRVAVQDGGLRMAWVGLIDPDARVVRPVAEAGSVDGYVQRLWIPLDRDVPQAYGPTAQAMREGRPVVVNDLAHDPRMRPWREEALRLGFRSSAAVPIRCRDEVIGNLNLYAAEPGFFGDEELLLLERLVADVAVGLESMRREEARERAEAAVREAETRYRRLFETAAEGIFVTDADGAFVTVNPAFARMFGYDTPAQVVGELNAQDLYRHAAERERLLEQLGAEGRASGYELEAWRRDGAPLWARLDVQVRYDEDGRAIGWQGMALDVTESHEATSRLAASESRLQAVIDNIPALVAVREVAGTRLLLVNRAFEEAFELDPGSAPGRPDEDVLPAAEALALRSMARQALGAGHPIVEERPMTIGGRQRTYLWSVFTLAGADEVPYATCAVATDITERKRAEEELRDRLTWSERISVALREGRMVAWSQPIIDLATGEQVSEELLVRMRDHEDPERLLLPESFLPAAERHGLIADIDRFMVDRAIELARSGRRVQVNLSGITIGDALVTQAIAERVRAAGLAPGALAFEITETAAVGAMDAAIAFARRMKDMGCGLALDDFGTGYGAMTYLRGLDVDHIKIDMSFVRSMTRSEEDRTIVRAVVRIARELGMRTIAEGVEDAETLALLREMGVDLAQGFHLGRPAPVA